MTMWLQLGSTVPRHAIVHVLAATRQQKDVKQAPSTVAAPANFFDRTRVTINGKDGHALQN